LSREVRGEFAEDEPRLLSREQLAVTGVRVVDLFAPFPIGGSLAVAGDLGSGVNVIAMEVMQNLCRRYEATAICYVTVDGIFNESNVRGWVDKLGVSRVVRSIEMAESAHIDVAGANGLVSTLLPFEADYHTADSWIVVRQAIVMSGRLPGVELHESGSKHLAEDARDLASRVSNEVDHGNDSLARYLAQPFFVAEPWTSTPGVVTEREEMLVTVRGLLLSDPPNNAD
jgi:F0F1-type ATP synthase beta subunit